MIKTSLIEIIDATMYYCPLTPSFVQVQLVHGEIFLDDPKEMSNPFTRH